MSDLATDQCSIASLPTVYQAHLVPLIFEPYAVDLVNRLAARPLGRVLEIAAGTGVVTRTMASVLPETVSIVATDLNQGMLDQAVAQGTTRPVEWRGQLPEGVDPMSLLHLTPPASSPDDASSLEMMSWQISASASKIASASIGCAGTPGASSSAGTSACGSPVLAAGTGSGG